MMKTYDSASHRLLETAATFCDRIITVFVTLAALLVVGMVALVCYEVFMRYALHSPPAWAWEVSECMLCLIAFLGAPWLLQKEGHVSVDIIYARLNPRAKTILSIPTSGLGVIICLILTWSGIGITIDHFKAGITVPGYLDIPKAPILLFIPLACFMLSIQFVRQLFVYVNRWRNMPNDLDVQ